MENLNYIHDLYSINPELNTYPNIDKLKILEGEGAADILTALEILKKYQEESLFCWGYIKALVYTDKKHGLVTQEYFDILVKNSSHAIALANGICFLKNLGICSKKNIDRIILFGSKADEAAKCLGFLLKNKLLNSSNLSLLNKLASNNGDVLSILYMLNDYAILNQYSLNRISRNDKYYEQLVFGMCLLSSAGYYNDVTLHAIQESGEYAVFVAKSIIFLAGKSKNSFFDSKDINNLCTYLPRLYIECDTFIDNINVKAIVENRKNSEALYNAMKTLNFSFYNFTQNMFVMLIDANEYAVEFARALTVVFDGSISQYTKNDKYLFTCADNFSDSSSLEELCCSKVYNALLKSTDSAVEVAKGLCVLYKNYLLNDNSFDQVVNSGFDAVYTAHQIIQKLREHGDINQETNTRFKLG